MREITVVAAEFAFETGVVRGQFWPGNVNWVLLIHEPGGDLDAWGAVPLVFAEDGYSVLAIDLPGHGLSDDPWVPAQSAALLAATAHYAVDRGARKRFVIAAGDLAAVTGLLPQVDGLIALSPTPLPLSPARTPPSLIFVGSGDRTAAARADAYFRASRGWAVVSSFAVAEQGVALYHGEWSAIALEQSLAFLRDYRISEPVESLHP